MKSQIGLAGVRSTRERKPETLPSCLYLRTKSVRQLNLICTTLQISVAYNNETLPKSLLSQNDLICYRVEINCLGENLTFSSKFNAIRHGFLLIMHLCLTLSKLLGIYCCRKYYLP